MNPLIKLEKYLSIIVISIKASSAYKIKLFFYALTGITQFISYHYLWSSLYNDGREYNGFTGGTILTYFVVSFLIQSIIPRWIAMEIGWGVKRGEIINVFLKPIGFRKYYLLYAFGDVIFTLIFMGLPIMLIAFFSDSLVLCGNILLFMFSLIISYGIAFNLFYLVGLISFVTTNIWGIFLTFDLVNLFLSGALLPLQFMPRWLVMVIKILPFRYIVDFPISVWLTGKADIYELLVQILWFILLCIVTKIVYRRAISRLDIFGG
ncbi:MAG: ABC transporter permease [Catonella sp.]|uniref:ABC transporter permease n=1 Tax=Catonella sp. TaxID=2382125 RepID=UPI003FA09218